MIKLAIYGKSGCGKSTIAKIIHDYYKEKKMNVQIIKLAQPLYDIQRKIYDKLHLSSMECGKDQVIQDQILLESIAMNIRRISPTYLVDTFMDKVSNSESSVIINDDLRDYHMDYPRLKESGFIFIKVTCKEEIRQRRLLDRDDISIVRNSDTTKNICDFRYHFHIDNSELSMNQLRTTIYKVLEAIQ